MRRTGVSPEMIWGIFSPILIYYLLSVGFAELVQILAGTVIFEQYALWIQAVSNFCIGLVLFGMYHRDRLWREAPEKGKAYVCRKPSVWIWAFLGGLCVSRGVNYVIFLTPLPQYFTGYEAVSEALYEGGLLSQIAVSVVTAPVLEETLMRGLVCSRIRRCTGDARLSVFGSALLFGLFHGNVVQGVYAFLLGLFFGEMYETCRSLIPVILAHMAANAAAVFFQRFPWLDGVYENPASYYLAAAVFLVGGMLSWKRVQHVCARSRQERL